ncbi:nuclear protein [Borealophlyctis nickersoniae]|nr:nuclear protein [Borealophlyctis nickersoniae]
MPNEEEDDVMDDGSDYGDEDGDGEDDSWLLTNPPPTWEERRVLRAEYRKFCDVGEGRDFSSLTLEELAAKAQQSNHLFGEVKTTQDAALDHRALLDLSNAAAKKIKEMRVDGGAFDVDEFVGKLVVRMRRGGVMGDDEEDRGAGGAADFDWFALRREAARWMLKVPTIDFMLGPLATPPKVRAKRENVAKLQKDKSDLRRPQQLTHTDIAKESETTTLVTQILERLPDYGTSIPFFQFVLNPISFSQTVENIFYLSFMVRDGRVELYESEGEGELMLARAHAPQAEAYVDGKVKRVQCIVDLDMQTWRELVDAYKIKESYIPHRKSTITGNESRWVAGS